jgi:hypothetical protein
VPGPDACKDPNCPCGEGEGDCDGNAECESGLTCAQNVGANYGWPASRDVCEQPGGAAHQVIIDNGDTGTGPFWGGPAWPESTGKNYYGSKSVYKTASGEGYFWMTQSPLNGRYEVFMWHTFRQSRCTLAPVLIYNGNTLIDNTTVDQYHNPGQWNSIGTYDFNAQGIIIITSSPGCSTCADAVKFVQK